MDAIVGVAEKTDTTVLSLNSGSSSLKLGLFSFTGDRMKLLAEAEVEAIGAGREGRIWLRRDGAYLHDERKSSASSSEAARSLLTLLEQNKCPAPDAVGHRIVHGGPHLTCHQTINEDVLRKIEAASAFAPLHIAPALEVIRYSMKHFPVPQIACFDTVFHHSLPEKAARFPIPDRFWAAGIRRYGFHGLSCESIIAALGEQFPDRAVIAHLGNGSSVTAVYKGKSVETTMGLTPAGGVMMATRTGDLDPGLLLYLLRSENYNEEDLDKLLNHESGMLGVSGLSGDMRTLIESSQRDGNAAIAIEMFCYSVQKSIGAMAAVLNGIELLVFTGGIGEHVPGVRSSICRELGHLGITLDPELNADNSAIITVPESACMVRVVPSQEEAQIATHALRIFRGNAI